MSLLPDPPRDDTRWSVITLSEWLCVTPAVVDAQLAEPTDDALDSPDLVGDRYYHSYAVPGAGHLGDCWLTDEAAERIAASLPAASIARAIQADTLAALETIGGPALLALASHVLDHAGSAA